ncbi:Site-specific recombinase XerD [Thalassobacillus cyri]|uniref:Site-specific recombinase XerD n=1 Tax=Thalassobacillus cyri TaxID=571932 RepID=A0A1H4BWP7_9BACI|nr:tyrosine-type recombinase/integrase [Thalassobacillus cyri]SEA52591.1 Site-specific recombinase XerD [Thalassobacillus cyri]
MHCEKITLKSGQVRWECVSDGPRDPVTGKRKQITRRAIKQKDAKKKVLQAIHELERYGHDYQKSGQMTFDELAHTWYEMYKVTGKKDSTLLRCRKDINILNKHIAKKPIANITHFLYQNVINTIFNDYARNTVKGIHSTGNRIFKFAKKNNWITENPALDIDIPKRQKSIFEIKKDAVEEKYLDREELEQFLAAAVKYGKLYDKERFYTLAFSGMRPGELCALKKEDLNFETNTIDITKTIYNESNNMREYVLTPPKTEGSVREVIMEKKVMDMLRKVVNDNDKRKLKLRNTEVPYYNTIVPYHDENFVFARPNGFPFNTIQLNKRMNRLLKYTDIQKKATPHIFRHTHVSMLAEAKVELATIMKRVGHDDAGTTVQIYTHVTNKMKKEAPVKISELYGNLLEKMVF